MMKLQDKSSTVFLKTIVILMSLGVLLVCTFVLPTGIRQSGWGDYRPIILGMYATTIPFFIGLSHTYKLLVFIDSNTAFSHKTISSLKKIKYCGVIIGVMYFLGMPFIFRVAQLDDAPGIVLIGLIFAGAPLIAALFASIMQTMFQNAIQIKTDNDLTV